VTSASLGAWLTSGDLRFCVAVVLLCVVAGIGMVVLARLQQPLAVPDDEPTLDGAPAAAVDETVAALL
jgi:hypothetical protein